MNQPGDPIHVALLRGINMGGHNLIKMVDLQAVLSSLGCGDVRTYIQSGNVVFRAAHITAGAITSALQRSHGIRPAVILLDQHQFRSVAAGNPFQDRAGNRVHVFFFDRSPGKVDTDKIDRLKIPSEECHTGPRAFYLHAPDGVARSRLAQGLDRCFDANLTARNLNTVNRILEMLEDL